MMSSPYSQCSTMYCEEAVSIVVPPVPPKITVKSPRSLGNTLNKIPRIGPIVAYKYLEMLGEGTYGIVCKAERWVNDRFLDHVAIKTPFVFEDEGVKIANVNEIDSMSKLGHVPYILKLDAVTTENFFEEMKCHRTPDRLSLVMEYIPTTLYDYSAKLMDNGGYTLMKSLMVQILCGMESAHHAHIIHGDLNLYNILVDPRPVISTIKIADWGLARQVFGEHQVLHDALTTSWYRAPELFLGCKYTDKIDVWSIGCIFFEMLAVNSFIEGRNDLEAWKALLRVVPKLPIGQRWSEIRKSAVEKQRMPHFHNVAGTPRFTLEQRIALDLKKRPIFEQQAGSYTLFLNLLEGLLDFDPVTRYSVSMALNHSFFADYALEISKYRTLYKIPCVLSNEILMCRSLDSTIVNIIPCREHEWVIGIVDFIYSNSAKVAWFDVKTLFHGLELWDRLLADNEKYMFPRDLNNCPLFEINYLGYTLNIKNCGSYFTPVLGVLYFFICLYLSHKYEAAGLFKVAPVKEFFPSIYHTEQYINLIEVAQIALIRDVFQGRIYNYSLLEGMNYKASMKVYRTQSEGAKQPDSHDIRVQTLLTSYRHTKAYYGTLHNLMESIL